MLCDDLESGMGEWEGSPKGTGYMYTLTDSRYCIAETNITWQSNSTPIKKCKKKKKTTHKPQAFSLIT